MANGGVLVRQGATVWEFKENPLRPGDPPSIHWAELLPQGVGTKHEREYLTKSCKQFLAAQIELGYGHDGTDLSAGTVKGWFTRLKILVRWMIQRHYWRFSQLRPRDLTAFVLDRDMGKVRNGAPAAATLASYVRQFELMWELRAMHVGSLRVDPYAIDLRSQTLAQGRDSRPWRAVDEPAALALVQDAIEWVDRYGAFMAKAATQVWTARAKMVGLSTYKKKQRTREVYAALGFEPEAASLRCDLHGEQMEADKLLARGMTTTEGACMIVVLFLVGLRASELLRLNAGCVSRRVVAGHEQLLAFIEGVAAKKSGAPKSWVVVDPVVSAIACVEQINAQARQSCGQSALFVRRPNGAPTCLPGRAVRRLTTVSIANRIKGFRDAWFRRDRPAIAELHAHRARKTLARFLGLRDKRALESLAHHYGHLHALITDSRYVGTDIDLLKEIQLEERRELASGLMDLLSCTALAGQGGRKLLAARHKLGIGKRLRGRRGLEHVVEELIERGVRLAPCDWGYCVYEPSLAACKGDARGPNEFNRSPEVCASCQNFAVTNQHMLWWNARLERETQFLERDDLSAQTRALCQKRQRVTSTVLQNLVASQRPLKAGAT